MTTYVEIATSRSILKMVTEEMDLTPEQKDMLGVTGELVSPTNIIEITVESDDPVLARTCADLVGVKTIEYVENLYEAYDMKPLDPAYTPRIPSKPDKVQYAILAAILGLLAGVGLAFLRDYLSTSEPAIVSASIIDNVTGMYNQSYFMQRLAEEMSRAKRRENPVSLAVVDIEGLDVVDGLGLPNMRNKALRQIGLFIKQYLREGDLVARFGGSQFGLLMLDLAGTDAQQVLEKIQTRIEWNIFELDETEIKLNLNITGGIATYDFDAGREELVSRARQALQTATDDGYGKIHLFDQVPSV